VRLFESGLSILLDSRPRMTAFSSANYVAPQFAWQWALGDRISIIDVLQVGKALGRTTYGSGDDTRFRGSAHINERLGWILPAEIGCPNCILVVAPDQIECFRF
jgi:hypothetical protein